MGQTIKINNTMETGVDVRVSWKDGTKIGFALPPGHTTKIGRTCDEIKIFKEGEVVPTTKDKECE